MAGEERRRDLFQKQEVVTSIVLAMLLQFTTLARIIPDNVTDANYVLRITVAAVLALLVIIQIWAARRIGIYVISKEKKKGALYVSVGVWLTLMAVFISIDSYCWHFHAVAAFPLSVLMLLWLLAYLISSLTPSQREAAAQDRGR